MELVFVAKRLKEALKVEEILTAADLDYLVETATYMGGFLFKRELTGAFFYVPPQMLQRTTEVMTANGCQPYQE